MMIYAGFLALIPVGFIAVLALSKKTSPAVKKVAIAALILTGLALITCTLILFFLYGFASGKKAAYGTLPVVPVEEAKKNIVPLLIAVVGIIILMILVIILAIREQRRK